MIKCQTRDRRRLAEVHPTSELQTSSLFLQASLMTSNIHEGSVSQCKHMQAKHAVNVYKSALGSLRVEACSQLLSVGGSSATEQSEFRGLWLSEDLAVSNIEEKNSSCSINGA